MKQGKIWGSTQKVFEHNNVECHLIHIKAGHACSLHRHIHRHNGFLVISGELVIEVHKNDYDLVDRTRLLPGQSTYCKAGEHHRFVAKEDTVAIEWYWVKLDKDDIERKDHGHELSTVEFFNIFPIVGVKAVPPMVGGEDDGGGDPMQGLSFPAD